MLQLQVHPRAQCSLCQRVPQGGGSAVSNAAVATGLHQRLRQTRIQIAFLWSLLTGVTSVRETVGLVL